MLQPVGPEREDGAERGGRRYIPCRYAANRGVGNSSYHDCCSHRGCVGQCRPARRNTWKYPGVGEKYNVYKDRSASAQVRAEQLAEAARHKGASQM